MSNEMANSSGNIDPNDKSSFAVAENVNLGIFIYQDRLIRYANPFFFDTFYYRSNQVYESKDFFKTIAPEYDLLISQYFNRLISGSLKKASFQFKGITLEGDNVFLKCWVKPVTFDNAPAVLGSFIDITEQKLIENELDHLASFPELNSSAIIETDGRGFVTYMNPAAQKSFPILSDMDKNIDSILDINFSGINTEIFFDVEFGGRFYEVSCFGIAKIDRYRFYFKDSTEKKEVKDNLMLTRQVFDHTAEGIMILDEDKNIISVNPAFTKITGYSAADVLGKHPNVLKSDKHNADFHNEMIDIINKESEWKGEIWNRRKSGDVFLEWLTVNAVRNKAGKITRYIAIFSDITDIRQSKKDIEFLSHHDSLTGLPNLLHLQDRLTEFIAERVDKKERIAVLFLDMDRFKNINNTLGHIVGDLLLIEVGKRLQDSLPERAQIARIGADDFIIVLPHIEKTEEAIKYCQSLFGVMEHPFMVKENEFFITLSIGVAVYPYDGEGIKTLFQSANIALQRAKERGGNAYSLYSPQMNIQSFENLILENHLRMALKKDEFVIYYQPQVDSRSGELIGAEALVRWIKPDLGIISPAKFIPLAEETGTIIPIGEWILFTACKQMADWLKLGIKPFRLSVNLSGRQFRQPNIVELIARVLEETEVPAKYLTLEITESITMDDVDHAIQVLKEINSLGVQIAIDDFGTGYSSLSYLKEFPIHKLKIDRAFVKDLPGNKDDVAISNTIIQLSQNLNLGVIAEGVETKDQLELLKEMGCFEIQGYYYSKPLPGEQFARDFLELKEN